jgi:hypothetical protein
MNTPEEPSEPQFPHWPGDWPGRQFVNLDCVGDPGYWLDVNLPSVEEVLLQDPKEDESMAEALADAYIRAGEELCFPLPTEHGATAEETRQAATSDFIGFIHEWRKRAQAAGCLKLGANSPKSDFPMWDVLPSLGFLPDANVISDVQPGLSRDFGNLRLSASCGTNRNFREVVLFMGILTSERSIAEVIFELPPLVESREQALAFLVWSLDQHADGKIFMPRVPTSWLEEGRKHRYCLPWERELAAYAARPHCTMHRKWASIALKALADHLTEASDGDFVTFEFDGEVLKIRCEKELIAVPAQGKAWVQRYSISAGALKHLPKRLATQFIEVSIWDNALCLARRRFNGAIGIPKSESTTDRST